MKPSRILSLFKRRNAELKALNKFLERRVSQAIGDRDEALEMVNRQERLNNYDEGTARACLCQLRVMQMNAHGRTGYGVTAFIPNEVLETLGRHSAMQTTFRDAVFSGLLEQALRGMWHINSRGNISAILFAPLGAKKEGICGAVFDADCNPRVEFARSKAADPVVRRIEQGIIEAQPENNKRPEAAPTNKALVLEPKENFNARKPTNS